MPKHDFKVFDSAAMLFDAVTTVLAQGNWDSTAVDLGGPDYDRMNPGEVVAILSGLAGAGATVSLTLLDCDTLAGTYAALTPVQVLVPATAFDDALWADTIRMPIPKFGVRRYLKLRITVATADLTASVVSAGVVK